MYACCYTPDKTSLGTTSLRAFDAIQLSSALLANQLAMAQGLPAVIFLSADNRLTTAAQSEGLRVDNPNRYP